MQLLERFEIALSLGQGALLIPSMLPEQRPALPFAMPLPSARHNSSLEPKIVRKSTIKQGSVPSSVEEIQEVKETENPDAITAIIDGREVKYIYNYLCTCVYEMLSAQHFTKA